MTARSKFVSAGLPLILMFFILCCTSHQQLKFNKDKWNQQTDPLFPSAYRNKMLTDLTTHYKLVGITIRQLTELLGTPDRIDSSSLIYKVAVDYKNDIDPLYEKSLYFTFSADSTITSVKVDEWNKANTN